MELLFFVVSLVIVTLILMYFMYRLLSLKKNVKKEKVVIAEEKEYHIDDYNSYNAKLFGINKVESEEELEKTKIITPINIKEINVKKEIDNNSFESDEDLPRLKQ